MSIIASIQVYNFHLIISYLSEGIRIVPFVDNRQRYFNSKAKYLPRIESGVSFMEMVGKRHILFGTQNSTLTGFNLLDEFKDSNKSKVEFPFHDISQIAIDKKQGDLFAFSDNKGFLEIDISSNFNPNTVKELPSKFLDQVHNPIISNIETLAYDLLISVRNFGIASIPLKDSNPSIIKLSKEVRSTDPQDAKKIIYDDLIAIADCVEGLLLYNYKSKKFDKRIMLPNNDFPQQIEIIYSEIIIKGSRGLYQYSLKDQELSVLREGKIGAIATYYDYIFFTSKGNVFVIAINNSFKQHNFRLNRQNLDFDFEKIYTKM